VEGAESGAAVLRAGAIGGGGSFLPSVRGAAGSDAVGVGAGASGAAAVGGAWGRYEEPGNGIGTAAPGWLNEPMAGGAVETGAAGIGAGAGISDPGIGGALALCGTAIWPISGTMLGTGAAAGTAGAVAEVLTSVVGPRVVVSSLSAMLICTTASTHRVPQASAEERSRSEARMVDGGVTGC
jgi:hypothetical protein